MFSKKQINIALTIIVGITLTACGGGGSSTNASNDNQTPEQANAVISKGIITGFGSVFINGVRFETENSRIVSEDDGSVILQNPNDAQLQSVLGLGQVITISGSQSDSSNGIANTISVDNELRGPVSSVSSTNASFVVLGQTVSVTPNTIIDDSIIEAARGREIPADLPFSSLPESLNQLLPVGMIVEISGLPSQNGFEATRIEDVNDQISVMSTPNASLPVEVKGTVSSLTSSQFEINGLVVIYEESDLDNEDFANQALANGQFVEVHGSPLSSTMIEATRIELENQFSDDNFLNNQDNIRTSDIAISNDGVSFTTRLGLKIAPTNRSRLEDDTVNDDDNLSISNFLNNVSGKRIEARGFSLNNNPVWTRLEIEDDSDLDCRLRGPVSNISGTANDFSFKIQGVVIDTSQVQNNNFEGANQLSIGRSAFFNNLSNGHIIQATSDNNGNGCTNGQLTAREVEFEAVNGVSNINNVNSNSNSNNLDNSNNSSDNSNSSISNSNLNDTEINGTVGNVSANSFVVGGKTISVNANTLIDDSLIENARGVEISNDLPFGGLSETLQQLLPIGLQVEVQLSHSNGLVAISIEDD